MYVGFNTFLPGMPPPPKKKKNYLSTAFVRALWNISNQTNLLSERRTTFYSSACREIGQLQGEEIWPKDLRSLGDPIFIFKLG